MFRPTQDIGAVAAFLEVRFGEIAALVPLTGGEWSQAFAFRAGAQELVVRFGHYAEDYEKDRVAAGFASADLPIPEIVEIGEAFDGVYAVSVRAHGRGFDALDEEGYRRVLPSLLRALDALREVDTSTSTGFGYWRPDGRAPHPTWRAFLLDVTNDDPGGRIHGWRDQLATVPPAVKTFADGYRLLEDLVDVCPEHRHVLHTDLIGDNVLIESDRVAAIVDWGNAMYGDFLYDLARLTFWTPWFPELARIDIRSLARDHYAAIGLNVPDFEARMQRYEVHIGLDAQAYNAFTERWDELDRSGRRTLEVGHAV